MKKQSYNNIIIALCAVAVVALSGAMQIIQNNNIQNFNGVLQVFQFFLCLIMVIIDYKKGAVVSNIVLGIALFNMLRLILLLGILAPLPGACNMIIYLITLNFLSIQLKHREIESKTDFLTGLQNRRGLYDYLSEMMKRNNPFYVIYFDIENFKIINDNYGHRYGDVALKEVASRIKASVEKNTLVFRVNGDEFVIVVKEKEDSYEVAQKVINNLSQKFTIITDGNSVDARLNVYAGISMFPYDAENADSLIKYADIAMNKATADKKDGIAYFDKAMADKLKRQMELEELVKESLEKDYFSLDYQPCYRISDKKLRGFEVLLRIRTADGVMASPKEFIPVAEGNELILGIDKYVINRAMKEFRSFITDEYMDIKLSINISSKNASSVGFADRVIEALKENGFPAKNLEIEITEYCLLHSLDTTIENINKLKDAGVSVALDDFGTGYTSLSYLAKLPISLLKLDKCLIDDIAAGKKNADFVSAVISLGHLIGCEVLAEGVEYEGQLKILNEQKCDYLQGFLWGRPMDLNAVNRILNKGEDK